MTAADQSADSAAFHRIAGVGGIAFALLIVTANLILVPAGLPHAATPIDEVVGFFAAEGPAVGVAALLIPLAWVASTLFAAGMLVEVRRRGTSANGWALVGFAGVLLQNGAFAGVMAVRLALATVAEADAAVAELVWRFHDALFTLNGTFLATALLGFSLAGWLGRLTGRLHLTLGLVAAGLLFASATLSLRVITTGGGYGLLGLVGWVLWVVWILVLAGRLVSGRWHRSSSA